VGGGTNLFALYIASVYPSNDNFGKSTFFKTEHAFCGGTRLLQRINAGKRERESTTLLL
jgi:hypothetical protein